MARVALEGVVVAWPDGTLGLRGLDLDAPSGQVTALLGPSGSGKTTALRAIAGLLEPSAGTVSIDGVPQDGLAPERRRAAMVFQDHALFPHLSAIENAAFGPRVQGAARREQQARAASALAAAGALHLAARQPATLSGGERQRVAIARALASRPRVLLLDEPLANLDAALRQPLRALIRDVPRTTGTTVVVVTHDLDEACALADRLVLVRAGAAVQSGAPRELLDRPADAWAARFLGATNLIQGVWLGGTLQTGLGPLATGQPAGADGLRALAVLRPEHLALAPVDGPSAPNRFIGVVRSLSDRAHHVRLVASVGAVPLVVHLPPRAIAGRVAGDEVVLAVAPEDVWAVPDDQPQVAQQ